MAARIVGNVMIIDSSGEVLTLPNSMLVGAAALYGTDSSSKLIITFAANASNSCIALANPINAANTVGISFGPGVYFAQGLTVTSLVAGTGYLYLR